MAESGVDVELWPWGVLIVAVGLYAFAAAALIAAGRREDARAVVGFIPDCVVLVSRLARDPHISPWRRTLLFIVLGYLALPIDVVPDFLPGVGHLDDAAMLALALRVLARGTDGDTLRAAWPGPESSLRVILIVAGAAPTGSSSRVEP